MHSRSSAPLAQAPWARRFFTIWTGQTASILGSQLVQFALIWHITQKTGSATMLALASLVGILPMVVLGPITGTLVDRLNRRHIMILADGTVATATAVLAALFAANLVEIWHIFILLFVRAVAGGFHMHAMGASIAMLVPKEHLARIQGVNQARQGTMEILSAPLGALLLAVLPIQGILAIDIVTAIIAIAPLLFLDVPQPKREAHAVNTSLAHDFREGLRFVLGWRGLLAIMAMALVLNFLLTPTMSLMPLLVKNHFGGDAAQFGWLTAAWGLGIICGGVLLGAWGGFKNRMVTALIGLIGMGLGVLLVGIAPANGVLLAVVGMGLAGVMNTITNGSIGAVMQGVIPPAMQGRVMSLISTLAMGITPLSLMAAGPLADLTGLQLWFWVSGAACIGMAVIGYFTPAVMNIESDRKHGVVAPATSLAAPELALATETQQTVSL